MDAVDPLRQSITWTVGYEQVHVRYATIHDQDARAYASLIALPPGVGAFLPRQVTSLWTSDFQRGTGWKINEYGTKALFDASTLPKASWGGEADSWFIMQNGRMRIGAGDTERAGGYGKPDILCAPWNYLDFIPEVADPLKASPPKLNLLDLQSPEWLDRVLSTWERADRDSEIHYRRSFTLKREVATLVLDYEIRKIWDGCYVPVQCQAIKNDKPLWEESYGYEYQISEEMKTAIPVSVVRVFQGSPYYSVYQLLSFSTKQVSVEPDTEAAEKVDLLPRGWGKMPPSDADKGSFR